MVTKVISAIALVVKHGPTLWTIGKDIWEKVRADPNQKTPTAKELLADVKASGSIDELLKRLADPSKVKGK